MGEGVYMGPPGPVLVVDRFPGIREQLSVLVGGTSVIEKQWPSVSAGCPLRRFFGQ
jgi:hypothetical protein